jgi:hypothetical protein
MTISQHHFWNSEIDRTWNGPGNQNLRDFGFSTRDRPTAVETASAEISDVEVSGIVEQNADRRSAIESLLASVIDTLIGLQARHSLHRSNDRIGQQVLISYFFNMLCAKLDEEIERSNGLRTM